MGKYIDGSGLSHLMGIIKGALAGKSDTGHTHTDLVKNVSYDSSTKKISQTKGTTTTEVVTLAAVATSGSASDLGSGTLPFARIPTGSTSSTVAVGNHTHSSYVNQNAFANVKVGTSTVAADTATDTLELVAGDNVTLTPDTTNDKVTIAATDTVYTHPSHTAHSTSAIYKFTNDALGHVNAATAATANDIVTLLGSTAVNRATGDASGNSISGTYAPKASPALTGTPTAPTAAAGTNSTQIATTAFVANAVGTATAGALQYKGTVDAETTITGAAYKKGWYYVVSTAGTYVGKVCEVGDMLIAKQDKTSTPANDWDAVQSNIEVLSNSEIDALWAAA